MSTGNPTVRALAIPLALAALPLLGGCGSSEDSSQAALSSATAEQLAAQSDRIAAELDAGDTCAAAHSADDLSAAVSQAEIPDEMRPEIEDAAQQLVDQVNCELPEETTTEEQTTTQKKEKDEGGDGERGPPGHGGEPPGQAKKPDGQGDD